ncbi:MAG: aldehyde dehydrogenase family protein [Actinomycetales bacterium]
MSPAARLDVRKTYKLFIAGAFPRSESGRSYQVRDAKDRFWANAAAGSRKDARDAVTAARKAQGPWAAATAYNRGQVLYRVAEIMQGRAEQLADEVARGEGLRRPSARAVVSAAIDRWVWYAGWTDKIAQVASAVNPVAGPFWSVSSPEPTGVVAVLAPRESSLLGLVSVLAPVLVSGNAAVVVASGTRPVPSISLAEILATSDVPGGVVNILTGRLSDLAPTLAAHADVNAIDLTGAVRWADQRPDPDAGHDAEPDPDEVTPSALEASAAGTLKRVLRPPGSEPDWSAPPSGPQRILRFTETKTVWHPRGT